MTLKDAVDWLCANIDLTNIRQQATQQQDCWKLLHLDGGNRVEVLHVPTGAVYRFTVEQVRPPA